MKKISILLMVAIVVSAFLVPAPAKAQWNLPPICSGVMLQNTTASAATTVNFDFYKQGNNSGVPAATYAVPGGIAAGSAQPFYIPDILPSSVPDGIYSVVVTSDQQLNSLVNEDTCRGLTGQTYVGASHAGVSDTKAATSVYLAFVMARAFQAAQPPISPDWSSQIAVQNADTTDADILVEFYASGNSTPVYSYPFTGVKPGESIYMDLSTSTYSAMAGFYGAAKISSTNGKKLAAVTNYGPANGTQFLSYNGEVSTSTKLYATQLTKEYYGYTSGFTLYNPNGTATNITLTFKDATGSTVGSAYTDSLAANSTKAYFLGNATIGGQVNNLPNGFNGGVIIEVTGSTNGILGIFNFDNRDNTSNYYHHSGAANMVRDEDKASTLYIPQLLRAYANFYAGFQIVNTSATAATLTMTFTNRDNTVTVINDTLAAGAIKGFSTQQSWANGLGSFLGGLKIEATGGQIVAQANLNSPYFSGQDGLLMYNAYTP